MGRIVVIVMMVVVALSVVATGQLKQTEPPIQAEIQVLDPQLDSLLAQLRAAKRDGDAALVASLQQRLGWTTERQLTPVPGDGPARTVVREELVGQPARWAGDVLVSNPFWSSGNPTMAALSDGTLYLVAEDQNNNYLDIYRSYDDGQSWQYIASINESSDPTHPSLVIAEGNRTRLLIAYVRGNYTPDCAIRVYYAHPESLFSAGTATIETNPSLGLGPPEICVDYPEYNYWYAYVTYPLGVLGQRQGHSILRFSRSLNYAEYWQSPTTIMEAVTAGSEPDIDYGDDNLYVVYSQGSPFGDIALRRSGTLGVSWESPVQLAHSTYHEDQPRIAATNGGGAVVMAFTKYYSELNYDIEAYYSPNAGDIWYLSYPPYSPDKEMRVDLAVSPSFGKIHAAFWRHDSIQYTWANHATPWAWAPSLQISDSNFAVIDVRPTVATSPTQSSEACVAWADDRFWSTDRIYFDAASATYAVIEPDGSGDFPTIQAAVSAAPDAALIELADGVFSGPGNVDIDFMGKSLVVCSQGGDPEACIINCQGSPGAPHRAFYFHSGEGPDAVVCGIKIINGFVTGGRDVDDGSGGAMLIEAGSSPTIEGMIFENNIAQSGGGGLHVADASAPRVDGCLFSLNSSSTGGGGLHTTTYSTPFVFDCTFVANSGPLGGGMHLSSGSFVHAENTIIAFSLDGRGVYCDATSEAGLVCCDVFGNADGDWIGCLAGQQGGDGNFSADPRFCNIAERDYRLAIGSPCLPANNSCGVLIGVYGVGCIVVTAVDAPTILGGVVLAQNHPNPFNPYTEINFSLTARQPVQLEIFDVTGRRVTTLVAETMPAGRHTIAWNGRDDVGRRLASGTYFYRLMAGSHSQTKRMLMLK